MVVGTSSCRPVVRLKGSEGSSVVESVVSGVIVMCEIAVGAVPEGLVESGHCVRSRLWSVSCASSLSVEPVADGLEVSH